MEACQSQTIPFKNPSEYIVCLHRKNNPRISVRICEQNCRLKEQCKEYQKFFDLLSRGHAPQLSGEAQVV